MSRTLDEVVNLDTFGVWKDRTNEIIGVLRDVTVTLGPSETNDGPLLITSGGGGEAKITADTMILNGAEGITLSKIQGPLTTTEIDIPNSVNVTGGLTVTTDETTYLAAESKSIEFFIDAPGAGAPIQQTSWTIGPNATHGRFEIQGYEATGSDGSGALLYIDDDANIVDGNVTIASNLLSGAYTTASVPNWTNKTVITFGGDIQATTLDIQGGEGGVGVDGELTANLTVDATTAKKWFAERTVEFADVPLGATTDVTGSFTIDGSQNVSVALAVVDNSHNHTIDNVTNLPGELANRLKLTTGGDVTGNVKVKDSQFNTGISLNKNGNIIATGDITAYGALSDINRKRNINKLENALEKVTTLSGYTFQYIDSEEMMTGLIAQEVEEVLPEAVYATTTHDGVPTKGLRYANMMGLIVEAIKDLRDEIEALKNQ